MGMLTKLQAVNRMLRGSSEPPVESLTISATNEALAAENLLDETNIYSQMAGLYVNTIIVNLVPDPVTFTVDLPDTTLNVIGGWWGEGRMSIGDENFPDNRDRNFVMRGFNPQQLFDLDRNSFLFPDDDDVTIMYTLLIEYDELPTSQQFRIVDQASRLYQMSVQGDPNMDQLLNQEAQISRAMARAADMRSKRPNIHSTGQNTLARRMGQVPRDWY